jgi:hypothetical protein
LYAPKGDGDPHDEIVRLEAHIEELAAKIESCRKFILASRVALVGGSIILAAMLFGAIRFDPAVMTAAVAALLGGIVGWGSNGSTAKEAAKELAAAESDRAALIEMIDLRVIPGSAFASFKSSVSCPSLNQPPVNARGLSPDWQSIRTSAFAEAGVLFAAKQPNNFASVDRGSTVNWADHCGLRDLTFRRCAEGQFQRFECVPVTSAFHPTPDMSLHCANGRDGPLPEVGTGRRTALANSYQPGNNKPGPRAGTCPYPRSVDLVARQTRGG